MGVKREEVMLSATSTTIKKNYHVLGFVKMGVYPICKAGFKVYHTFRIPTPTLGKKKENQPKKTPKPNHNTHTVHTTKHYSSLLGQSVILYSTSENRSVFKMAC